MKYRITTAIAALALGAAAAAAASPALAQQYGKSPNDGGPISTPQTNSKPLYNSAAPQTPAAPQYGKAANDGGPINEPSGSQAAATKGQTNTAQESSPVHYGKPLNDGGM
jgi:hypothetical protein